MEKKMEDRLYAAIDNRKVAIIGAGFVGASIAYALTIRDLASEIVLIDIDQKKAATCNQDLSFFHLFEAVSSESPLFLFESMWELSHIFQWFPLCS